MCQATVYLGDEEIMKDVISVEPTADGVRLSRFFEPPQIIRATIRQIDLIKHKVFLDPLPDERESL